MSEDDKLWLFLVGLCLAAALVFSCLPDVIVPRPIPAVFFVNLRSY